MPCQTQQIQIFFHCWSPWHSCTSSLSSEVRKGPVHHLSCYPVGIHPICVTKPSESSFSYNWLQSVLSCYCAINLKYYYHKKSEPNTLYQGLLRLCNYRLDFFHIRVILRLIMDLSTWIAIGQSAYVLYGYVDQKPVRNFRNPHTTVENICASEPYSAWWSVLPTLSILYTAVWTFCVCLYTVAHKTAVRALGGLLQLAIQRYRLSMTAWKRFHAGVVLFTTSSLTV